MLEYGKRNDMRSEVYNIDCMVYMRSLPDIAKWPKDLAQYTNKKQIFASCDFKEFSPRKGFTCKEYFT